MDESVEGIAITVGETADREGQQDKNHPDSVIVHTLALKQLPCSTRVMVTLFSFTIISSYQAWAKMADNRLYPARA